MICCYTVVLCQNNIPLKIKIKAFNFYFRSDSQVTTRFKEFLVTVIWCNYIPQNNPRVLHYVIVVKSIQDAQTSQIDM